jgi:hypothetical protein
MVYHSLNGRGRALLTWSDISRTACLIDVKSRRVENLRLVWVEEEQKEATSPRSEIVVETWRDSLEPPVSTSGSGTR